MAQILPFRAWRYNPLLFKNLEELTSPLFDVVSEKQRLALYKNDYNSIHLSVPPTPFAADRAAILLSEWKKNRIIIQDKLPTLYVYYQYFKLPGDGKLYCRKGFICNVRIYDWSERIIQRHESTIPKAVNDRIELLDKTELQVSPTHGLYTDELRELEYFMDEAITNPVYETEDYQGVKDVLALVHDAKIISRFISKIKGQNIILADGHHRYEASLANMYSQKRANPRHNGNEGYNFHMMYLTNTESDDLRILPTHRVIQGLDEFSSESFLQQLQNDFVVKEVEDEHSITEVIAGKKWTFGILLKDKAFKIKLKVESFKSLPWPFPEEIKRLDLTVMHYFIIEKMLGIRGKDQRKSENIQFNKSFSDCLKFVSNEEAQMAIITNEISIEEVKLVCRSGYTMPQKSTFFYPKVISGFVFGSIKEDEFRVPLFAPFQI